MLRFVTPTFARAGLPYPSANDHRTHHSIRKEVGPRYRGDPREYPANNQHHSDVQPDSKVADSEPGSDDKFDDNALLAEMALTLGRVVSMLESIQALPGAEERGNDLKGQDSIPRGPQIKPLNRLDNLIVALRGSPRTRALLPILAEQVLQFREKVIIWASFPEQ